MKKTKAHRTVRCRAIPGSAGVILLAGVTSSAKLRRTVNGRVATYYGMAHGTAVCCE